MHIIYTSNGSPYLNYQVGAAAAAQGRSMHAARLLRAVGCCLGAAVLQGLAGPARPCIRDTPPALLAHHPPPARQSLALYGTYRMALRMPGGDRMAALTRILHRTEVCDCVGAVWLGGWHAACLLPLAPGRLGRARQANKLCCCAPAGRRALAVCSHVPSQPAAPQCVAPAGWELARTVGSPSCCTACQTSCLPRSCLHGLPAPPLTWT